MANEFKFDRNSQRYRISSGAGKGQFLSKEAVDALTQKTIRQAKDDLKTIGNLLLKRKISVGTWEEATAKTLKTIEINQYAIGKGGSGRLNQRDYGLIGQRLKEQYRYLRGFSEDLIAGKLTEGQLWQRLNLYAADTRHAYELARTESHAQDGYNWERRLRHARDSCSPCIDYAAQGWQAIRSLPNPGDRCTCGSSCKCTKEFAKEKPGDMLSRRWGMIGHRISHHLKAS